MERELLRDVNWPYIVQASTVINFTKRNKLVDTIFVSFLVAV